MASRTWERMFPPGVGTSVELLADVNAIASAPPLRTCTRDPMPPRPPSPPRPPRTPAGALLSVALLALSACSSAPSPGATAGPGPRADAAITTAPDSGAPTPSPVATQKPAADTAVAEPLPTPLLPSAGRKGLDAVAEVDFGDAPPGAWTDAVLASLTLRQKVGQMIMPFVLGDYAPEGTPGHDRIVRHIEEDQIGGVIVSVGTPTDVAVKLNDLQRHSRLPLLVAADLETGAGFRLDGAVHLPTNIRLGGATTFPPPMALGATGDAGLAYEVGRVTAVEARAVGIHVPFAPVLDVNNNPDNPIINTRSFGEDAAQVSHMGRAFIRGIQEHGALATGKHFPGHGDTDTDSHLELPVIRADRVRLDTLELRPFREAVEAGLGGVMTAHIALPELTEEGELPATLSRRVLTDLLRDELGFDGLIFTDAMDMRAIDRRFPRGEATVRAVEAGADVILMPPSIPNALEAVMTAVQSGRISEARIDRSVRKLLRLKEEMGLHLRRQVPLEEVPRVVGIPEHQELSNEVARRSITLLRNDGDLLPLRGTRSARVLSVSLRRTNDLLAARTFDANLRSTYPRLTTEQVTRDTPAAVYDALLARARRSNLVVVSLYVTWNSYQGRMALPDEMIAFVEALAEMGKPHVVVSFGNPYLLREVPDARAYVAAWSGAASSQRAAARALFGDFPVTGRTPTRLPPFFEIGDGIRLGADGPVPTAATLAGADEGGKTGAPVNAVGGAGDPPGAGALIPEWLAAARAADDVRVAPAGPSASLALPERVGMDPAALARLDAALARGVAEGAAPGAALAVGRRGRLVRLEGFGVLDPEAPAPVTPKTLYDLASLTKVVGTTTAVMLLVDEGRLSLDDRVVEHLPGWDRGDPRKAEVTVRQLLLHRAGFAPFRRWFFELSGRADYTEALYDEPLEGVPGERTVYSDLGVMSLGLVVEAVAGTTLDSFLDARVFGPLGMADTRFTPPAELLVRIAPTERDTVWRNDQVWGRVHDENADAFGGVAGHAGLFSTAEDLAVFADLMLRGGVVPPCMPGDGSGIPCPMARPDSVRLIAPETVARFTRRHDAGSSRALGWDTPEGRSSAGDLFSAASFGHTGFTGTSIWIDPERELFVVLLTNRVNPTRANTRHVPLRRAVHDLAAEAVVDVPAVPRGEAGPAGSQVEGGAGR